MPEPSVGAKTPNVADAKTSKMGAGELMSTSPSPAPSTKSAAGASSTPGASASKPAAPSSSATPAAASSSSAPAPSSGATQAAAKPGSAPATSSSASASSSATSGKSPEREVLVEDIVAPSDKPGSVGWLATGTLLMLGGIGLAVTPRFLPDVARMLEPVGNLEVHTVTLTVSGLVLFVVGVVRRTLWGIRRRLKALLDETARLEQIAVEARKLQTAVDRVHSANNQLKDDVCGLRAQLTKLTEVASEPETATSMFRLAASVDQLGARLDQFVKEQFKSLQQRLTEMAELAESSNRQITSAQQESAELQSRDHQTQQLTLQAVSDKSQAAARQTLERVEQNLEATERTEAKVQSCHSAISSGFESTNELSLQTATSVTAALEDMRVHVDLRFEEQAIVVGKRIEQLDERMEQAERDRAAAFERLAAQVELKASQLSDGVEQGSNAGIEASRQASREMAERVEQLGARIDERARGDATMLRQSIDRATDESSAVRRELAAGNERISARIEEHSQANQAAWQRAAKQAGESSAATTREIGASSERLGAQLDDQARKQEASVQRALKSASDFAAAANQELSAGVKRLAARMDEHARNQQTSLQQTAESLASAHRELDAKIEQSGERVEASLGARVGALEASWKGFEKLADELPRAELTQSVERLAARVDEHARAQADSLQRVARESAEGTGDLRQTLDAAVEQAGTRVEQRLGARIGALEGAWSNLLKMMGEMPGAELTATVERLAARVEQHAREQHASLQQVARESAERTGDLRQALDAAVEQSGERVEQRLGARIGALETAWNGLEQATNELPGAELTATVERLASRVDEHAREQSESLQRVVREGAERTGDLRVALDASLEHAGARIEQRLGARIGALEAAWSSLEKLADELPGADLAETVERLAARVDEHAREQHESLQRVVHEAAANTGNLRESLDATLELIGARLEQRLGSRVNALEGAWMVVEKLAIEVAMLARANEVASNGAAPARPEDEPRSHGSGDASDVIWPGDAGGSPRP